MPRDEPVWLELKWQQMLCMCVVIIIIIILIIIIIIIVNRNISVQMFFHSSLASDIRGGEENGKAKLVEEEEDRGFA